MTQNLQVHQGPPRTTPFRNLNRARSWALLPFVDVTMTSTMSSDSSCSSSEPDSPATAALRTVAQSSDAPRVSSSQPQLTMSPSFIYGITHSSLTYEAIFALILSINVRELVGNGADALVKALVKKAVTLAAALFIALLLDCASPAMPMLGIDALEMEIRGAAGTISGWLGQQAGDPIGWKIEKRIAEYLWPKQPLSLPKPTAPIDGVAVSASTPHAVAPSLLLDAAVVVV